MRNKIVFVKIINRSIDFVIIKLGKVSKYITLNTYIQIIVMVNQRF